MNWLLSLQSRLIMAVGMVVLVYFAGYVHATAVHKARNLRALEAAVEKSNKEQKIARGIDIETEGFVQNLLEENKRLKNAIEKYSSVYTDKSCNLNNDGLLLWNAD